jgi:hypothetical protein
VFADIVSTTKSVGKPYLWQFPCRWMHIFEVLIDIFPYHFLLDARGEKPMKQEFLQIFFVKLWMLIVFKWVGVVVFNKEFYTVKPNTIIYFAYYIIISRKSALKAVLTNIKQIVVIHKPVKTRFTTEQCK